MNSFTLFLLLSLICIAQGRSEASSVLFKTIQYSDQGTLLESVISLPANTKAKHPGILVVPDWMGIGPVVKSQIEKLSQLGYTAMAVDVYGKENRPTNTEEAAKIAGKFKADRKSTRTRIQLALNELLKSPGIDPTRIAVMGYCFGGMVALELGRSGADVKGIVTFHGTLNTPTPQDAQHIKGQVLVFHGADDPYVNSQEVESFEKEMKEAKVDWELVKYGGAVHSFTNPNAGSDPSKGAAYNAAADAKSWSALVLFLKRIFTPTP